MAYHKAEEETQQEENKMVYCDYANDARGHYEKGRYYDLSEIVDNEDYYIDKNDDHLVVIHRVVDPVCLVDVSPIVARFEIMVLEA